MITLLLILAAFFAGGLNAVAGGGSFISFPALLFAGVPPVAANASNTLALFPATFAAAWAYREDFIHARAINLPAVLAVSIAGGLIGAGLLLWTPDSVFVRLIPWLLLFATVLFAAGRPIAAWLRRRVQIGPAVLLSIQFVIAIYGGYFGGGIGIMMLAAFAVFGLTDLHAMNGLKSVLAGCLNGVAVIAFIGAGQIWWPQALVMLVAAMAGGYVAARVARRIEQTLLRRLVIAIGFAMTTYFFVR